MSDHVTEWLSAYLDGELHGSRRDHVEAHLDECEVCQAELESLEGLSDLLQEIPMPELIPPERFAAQVNLRLSHSKPVLSRRNALEIGWWMIPVALLAAWVLIGVLFLVGDMLSLANNFGVFTSVSDWLRFGTQNVAGWSTALAEIGVLSGNVLDFAASTERLTRTSLWQVGLQTAIALLYLSWLAIWWARQRHREHSQLLEG